MASNTGVVLGDQRAGDMIVGAGSVDQRLDRQRDLERGVDDPTRRIELDPGGAHGRPLQGGGARDVGGEHAAHAAAGELGGLDRGVAERLRDDNLEGELTEQVVGLVVGRLGIDADVGRHVVDGGGLGQLVGGDLEDAADVGLEQRDELGVALGVGRLGGDTWTSSPSTIS